MTAQDQTSRGFSTAHPEVYRFPFPAFPNGWFALCFADEVLPGAVLALHRLGRDLVAWRDGEGAVRVADAYCPHLGAHFGHGGAVIDGELRCPFHHWRYDGSGACTYAAGAKRLPAGAKLHLLPALERNRLVFAWHDAAGRAPAYEIDHIPEIESGGYREVRQSLAQQAEATKEVIEAAKAASVKKASDATVRAGASKAAAAKPAPSTTVPVSGDAVDDEEDDAAQAATAGAATATATATAVGGESFDLFG